MCGLQVFNKKTTTHDCYYYLLISDSFPTSVLKSIRKHQHHCHYYNHDILSGWETKNKRAQSHPVSVARGWSQRMERPKKENKYMREREKWSFVLER